MGETAPMPEAPENTSKDQAERARCGSAVIAGF